jgi:hypothetical protein
MQILRLRCASFLYRINMMHANTYEQAILLFSSKLHKASPHTCEACICKVFPAKPAYSALYYSNMNIFHSIFGHARSKSASLAPTIKRFVARAFDPPLRGGCPLFASYPGLRSACPGLFSMAPYGSRPVRCSWNGQCGGPFRIAAVAYPHTAH